MSITRLIMTLTATCAVAALCACGDKPATPTPPATPPANNTPAPANGTPTPPPAGTVPERGGEPPRTTTPTPTPTPAASNDPMVGTWVADIDKCRPEIEKFMQQMIAMAPEKPSPEDVKKGIEQAVEEMKKTACEVKADGTYAITGADGDNTGTWKRDGSKYTFSSKDGETTEGTLNGGSFVLEAMGLKMYFKKK